MTTFTVTIKNASNDLTSSRRYFVFFKAPAIGGGSGRAALPVVFFKTSALSNGARSQFSFTLDLFGYIGKSSSASLKATDNLNLISAVPAKVTERGNGGKVLKVKSNPEDGQPQIVDDPADQDDAPQRAFCIYCDSDIAYPNHYVTGLARNLGDVGEMPTMALPVVSGQTFNITPTRRLVIVKGDDNQGSVVATGATADNSFELEFGAGSTSALVSNTSDVAGKSVFSATFS